MLLFFLLFKLQLILKYKYETCRDPDSGLIRNDVCLGMTRRDCDEMMWTTMDFNPNITMLKKLTEGIPVWIKIKAVNNGII